jgi:hypothetical protein
MPGRTGIAGHDRSGPQLHLVRYLITTEAALRQSSPARCPSYSLLRRPSSGGKGCLTSHVGEMKMAKPIAKCDDARILNPQGGG